MYLGVKPPDFNNQFLFTMQGAFSSAQQLYPDIGASAAAVSFPFVLALNRVLDHEGLVHTEGFITAAGPSFHGNDVRRILVWV
ncbi:predicted protein [Plenodomus lingam JN3]|uniref:Predicted protein n=1 Tax=Leptosphaeria maculans (strain JN3 / isolate v23.1.3 / race Av1-4-5-6-7-8) TaxID=985895 RepID=E5A8H1_LEPMJ|nr:predicted protein [Plenodomus lingam JN3]CBX99916.1 predicted protein [Plenodomus lingam JN3]